MKKTMVYKADEKVQHLILKIRIAVATGHMELLPELNSAIHKNSKGI